MQNLAKIPRGAVVIVKWKDAVCVASWEKQETFLARPLPEVATTGIWMGVTHDSVVLAHSVTDDDDCDGTKIPLGMVQSVDIIRRKKGKV